MSGDEAIALVVVFCAASYLVHRLWKRLRPPTSGPRREDLVQVSFEKNRD